MIGRFFYHAFWNFYDYLGTLTLIGGLHTLLSLGIIAAVIAVVDISSPVGLLMLVFVAIALFALTVLGLSGLLPFCARAARNEPARWPNLKQGVQDRGLKVAGVLGVWVTVFGILIVNFFFYLKFNGQVASPSVKMALVIVAATVGWLGAAWLYFGMPWLCATTASDDKPNFRQSVARGLMSIALLPGVWLISLVIMFFVVGVGLYTRLGLIFVLPVFASIGQTAYFLSSQYASFLAEARMELGDNHPLRAYKKRAREMGWDWEHRQPRRTFKELIKPWEY